MKKITSINEINKISRGDNKLVKDFITKFIDQLTTQLTDLTVFIPEENATAVKSIAHKMKSSFFYFGMHDQKIMAQIIEESIINDFTKTKPQLNELIESCRIAITELKEDLAKLN